MPYTGKLIRIVICDYVIALQANLPDRIFALQNFVVQSRLDTKHQMRGRPRQMLQLSWRPWQSLAAPSLGTFALDHCSCRGTKKVNISNIA